MGEKINKYTLIFIIILIISIGLKSSGLNKSLFDDEANYAYSSVNNENIGYVQNHYSGLVAQWTFEPAVRLLGLSAFSLRLVPLIITTLILIILFLWMKKTYGSICTY